MKKLLLTGIAVLLMATSASAQSSGPANAFFGGLGSGGNFGYSGGNFGYYAPRPPAQRSGCDSLCQSKCQASWRARGFRSVNACIARWHRLNAEGTAATCETAIKANGMRPVRGC